MTQRLRILSIGLVLLAELGALGGSAASAAAEAARLPILITFNVHGHNFGRQTGPTTGAGYYEQLRSQLLWLRQTAEQYGARLSYAEGGEYMEWVAAQGHQTDIQTFLNNGHTLGVHFHGFYREAAFRWRAVPPGSALRSTVERIWSDHFAYVRAVVSGEGSSRCDAAVPLEPTPAIRPLELHVQYGCKLVSAMELPYAQRRFLEIYLEWREQERLNKPPRVFTLGWNSYPHFIVENPDKYRTAIIQMLEWLGTNFIGKTSERGNLIARYATDHEVEREFLEWEQENPGACSLCYTPGRAYPYSLPGMPQKIGDRWDAAQQKVITGAAYEREVTTWREKGIRVHRLRKDGRAIYVLWKDFGSTTIDFSSELSDTLLRTTGLGEVSEVSSVTLLVEELPVFVEAKGAN